MKETHTTAISVQPVSMNGDHIHASVKVDSLEMDLNAVIPYLSPVLRSEERVAVSARISSLIQMAKQVWHHLQCTVTCVTRMELVSQSSVTTVKAEFFSRGVNEQDVTHVTFTTLERVCLSWRVSPESPHTVSSLSSTSVMVRF